MGDARGRMGKVKARCTLKDVSMWVERVVTRDEKDVISKEEAQVVLLLLLLLSINNKNNNNHDSLMQMPLHGTRAWRRF